MSTPFDELAPQESAAAALLARGDAFLRQVGEIEAALPLAAFFALAQEELREALALRQASCKHAEAAYRACDAADQKLDRTITDLSLATLALAGDTRDPLFSRLFPEGPQGYTFAPVDKELELVACLRERLDGHPLQAQFDPQLEAGSRAVAEAEKQLARSLDEEAAAWARTRKAEMAWRLRSRLARNALERVFREAGRPDLVEAMDRLLTPQEPAHGEPALVAARRQH